MASGPETIRDTERFIPFDSLAESFDHAGVPAKADLGLRLAVCRPAHLGSQMLQWSQMLQYANRRVFGNMYQTSMVCRL